MGLFTNKRRILIERDDTTPLINDLEIQDIFEGEDRREGDSVTDLIKEVL